MLPNQTWERDYPERAAHNGLQAHLHEPAAALAAANSLIDPVLTGTTEHGRWNLDEEVWTQRVGAA